LSLERSKSSNPYLLKAGSGDLSGSLDWMGIKMGWEGMERGEGGGGGGGGGGGAHPGYPSCQEDQILVRLKLELKASQSTA
jgi:hypothetical protein